MTEIYGPEEQVLVLSEQLHHRRESPFADEQEFPKVSRRLVFDLEISS